jgi:biopolymer transport protein ExbD
MKGHMPATHVSHPNVTPLIDIVMCLIIFYMLVAKIGVKTAAMKDMTLPVSLQGITLKDLGNTVDINVMPALDPSAPTSKPEGLPMITMLDPSTGQLVPVPILEQGNKHTFQNFLKKLKGENQEFKVIIRADQDLSYKYLQPVLIECALVKVKNINFATRKEAAITQLKSE